MYQETLAWYCRRWVSVIEKTDNLVDHFFESVVWNLDFPDNLAGLVEDCLVRRGFSSCLGDMVQFGESLDARIRIWELRDGLTRLSAQVARSTIRPDCRWLKIDSLHSDVLSRLWFQVGQACHLSETRLVLAEYPFAVTGVQLKHFWVQQGRARASFRIDDRQNFRWSASFNFCG